MRKAAIVLGFVALAATFSFSAKAQDNAKITYAYLQGPTEMPGGKVLSQGVYAFVMADDSSPSNKVVQIYMALPGGTVGTPSNFNQNKAMTPEGTALLVPDYHNRPAARAVTLWPAKEGRPPALKTLSFPVGQVLLVFAYPRERAAQLAKDANQPVPSFDSNPGSDVNAFKNTTLKATSASGQDVDETQVFGKPGDHPGDRPLGKGCSYEAGDVSCQFNPGEIRD